jgi:hypothetical protein
MLFLLWLLLILFVLIEHEVKCRKYGTIRTVAIEYGAHGGVASEGTKNNGRTAR